MNISKPTSKPPGTLAVPGQQVAPKAQAKAKKKTAAKTSAKPAEPASVSAPAVAVLILMAFLQICAMAATTNLPGSLTPPGGGTPTTNVPGSSPTLTPALSNIPISVDPTNKWVTDTNWLGSNVVAGAGISIAKTNRGRLVISASLGYSDGLIYVDAVNGSDSTGSGSIYRPYASLSKAKTNAVAGNTVYVLRGTFNEGTSVHKDGVKWYFEDGTVVTNTFWTITGTGTTNYVVDGRGTFLYVPLSVTATNTYIVFKCKEINATTILSMAAGGNSNTVWMYADKVKGSVSYSASTMTNVSAVNIVGYEYVELGQTGGSATGGTVTNQVLNVFGRGPILAGGNMSISSFGTMRYYGGQFFLNGKTLGGNAASIRWFFFGTSLASSNNLPGAGANTNVYGTYTVNPEY